jgi:predicted transposase/invertase (TIGR01784 family)
MAKEFKELCFSDNFMFCKVMSSSPELCRRMLELILNQKIRQVMIKDTENSIDITSDGKGIRMDVYLDDADGTVYDLEMQTTREKNLPKRMRYYQGMIDLNLIEKGKDYDQLPKTVVLFVCTFDYFKRGLPFYVFQNRCKALPELLLGDETEKIFVNPHGNRTGLPEEVTALLDYIKNNKATDALTRELDNAVKKVREHKEWEIEYMNWRAYEMDKNIEKRMARAAGLAQGLEVGRSEGRAAGLAQGLEKGRKDIILNMHQKGFTLEQIADATNESPEEIRNILKDAVMLTE